MPILVSSPVGPLAIESSAGAIASIHFHAKGPCSSAPPDDIVWEAARQLQDYFEGRRRTFSLPLAPAGTAFQLSVWQALREIPYGETISYAELARRIGRPAAVRAAGAANGHNPIPIVIPCHRVIGSDGTLVGFGGGVEMKRYLLGLERGTLF